MSKQHGGVKGDYHLFGRHEFFKIVGSVEPTRNSRVSGLTPSRRITGWRLSSMQFTTLRAPSELLPTLVWQIFSARSAAHRRPWRASGNPKPRCAFVNGQHQSPGPALNA